LANPDVELDIHPVSFYLHLCKQQRKAEAGKASWAGLYVQVSRAQDQSEQAVGIMGEDLSLLQPSTVPVPAVSPGLKCECCLTRHSEGPPRTSTGQREGLQANKHLYFCLGICDMT
jgi:hypothetical protein